MDGTDARMEAWASMVRIARDLLDGKAEAVPSIHAIVKLSFTAGADREAAVLPFVGILSEIDHVPLPEFRSLYASSYLERTDAELSAYLARKKEYIANACKALIEASRPA